MNTHAKVRLNIESDEEVEEEEEVEHNEMHGIYKDFLALSKSGVSNLRAALAIITKIETTE